MVKRTGFGKGPSGPSQEELEREAAAELRRAMGGSDRPRTRGVPGGWTPPEPTPEPEPEYDVDDGDEEFDGEVPEWMPGLTAEQERRAITDLAMRQLTERPGGNIRPEDTLLPANISDDAENMRNKALADFMARQQKMAKDRPAPSQRISRTGPPVVQKTSGWTISPNLTTKPTMTGGPSGFSPDLEAQAGMSRLKVDPNSPESRQAREQREPRKLRAAREARVAREHAEAQALPPSLPEAPEPQGARAAREPQGARAAREPRAARDSSETPGTRTPRERPLRAATDRSGSADGGDWNRPVKPGRKVAPSPAAPGVAAVPAGPEPRASEVAASPATPGKAPAVRNRPVQRRAAPRVAGATEPDARWRVLAELADLLAEEVFPGDTLPEVCRWLAGIVNATVAILLLADDAIDDVSAWPVDDPVIEHLGELVGEPVDEQSTIWAAVGEGRTLTGAEDDEPLVLPDGVGQADLAGWAVVPLIDRTVAFGTILVTRTHGDALPDATVSLVEEVAKRVARALLNCEEAASTGDSSEHGDSSPDDGSSDNGVPTPIRDRLGALSFLLGVIESPTGPRLPADQGRRYAEIVARAAKLQTEVTEFLNGQEAAGQ